MTLEYFPNAVIHLGVFYSVNHQGEEPPVPFPQDESVLVVLLLQCCYYLLGLDKPLVDY